jgi:hypothetical protein
MGMDKVIVRASDAWVDEEDGKYITDLVEVQRGERKAYFVRDLINQTRFILICRHEYDIARRRLDEHNAKPLHLEEPREFLHAIDNDNYEEASRWIAEYVRIIKEEGLKGIVSKGQNN